MKFGLVIANVGTYASVTKIVSMAEEAERAGWDGVFLWDQIIGMEDWNQPPMCDPWVALGAVALATKRVRIGTMISAVGRRRPWILARQATTVDRMSRGRVILGVGLGNPPEEFSRFGEEADNRVRAEKLDEGLDILDGLWSSEPFSYEGKHYRLNNIRFTPPPVQRPRIPIWVAGQWPNKRPLRRAARYDGVYPIKADGSQPLSLDELQTMLSEVRRHRASDAPFDVVLMGGLVGKDGQVPGGPSLAEYEAAGATWWMTEIHDLLGPFEDLRRRVQAGPLSV